MRHEIASLIIGLGYLGFLFLIAAWADKRAAENKSVINSPLVYAFSIAVYCTAWTFYGSVGRAAETGLTFVITYLGPTLAMLLGWVLIRKMQRITKAQKITSIADFISARFGKSSWLGILVTLIAVIGIMPYIALQLKAITLSHALLTNFPNTTSSQMQPSGFLSDKAFWVALVLALFTLVFGTRHLDASERHEGMVAAIAFESLIKLIAFLAVGIFVVFWLYQGPLDLLTQAAKHPNLKANLGLEQVPGGALGWVGGLALSTLAFLTLPRQFQVLVIENVNENHLKRASWVFPLYLLIINLMVLPLALAGLMLGKGNPDDYVLTLPLAAGYDLLAVIVFLGGLSAATGMVIVETIALSTMVSNHLVMPLVLRWQALHTNSNLNLSGWLLGIRRVAIIFILLLGYLYHSLIGDSYTLVTTGMVSFAAASQFAPALLIGLYWRGATAKGAAAGLIGGFLVWAYTLLLPGFAMSGWLDISFIEQGPWQIGWLKPYALFGLDNWDIYTHALFYSLLVNLGLLIGISLFTRPNHLEQTQAALFTQGLRPEVMQTSVWLGQTSQGELYQLVKRYLGQGASNKIFSLETATSNLGAERAETAASPRLIAKTEQALTGALGSASARVLVNSVIRGQALDLDAVLSILDTTSQALEYNKRLEQQSAELALIGEELRAANERLREVDKLKDEFIATVSHELRTPLTSIRAFAEILNDTPDLEQQQKQQFLQVIVKESKRLSRLIEDILDLARIESGRLRLELSQVNLTDLITDAATAITQIYQERQVELRLELNIPAALVKADADRLQQVLINLLDNASKFTSKTEPLVELSLEEAGNSWLIAVEDNGAGIAAAERKKIFEKFHQIKKHQASNQLAKGTGLGLAISRGIMQHHGGLLYVTEPQKLQGARFVLELPKNSH